MTLEEGTKYHVVYRWKSAKKEHDFIGTYVGLNPSPAQGQQLHTFDLGGGATFYLGEARIVEAEAL